jgi:uncharacterized linocin/CFP29 family protein
MAEGAKIETGKSIFSHASGRWAGEQFLKALSAGKDIDPSCLRTLDTLRKDEWIAFDEALVESATLRLKAVADLVNAGLTIPVNNAMGKTIFQYEEMTDMEPALTSMDGAVRTEGDRVEFSLNSLPLPITHKDFFINLRTLTASRNRGESLDTTQARVAGRLVGEATEQLLIDGGGTYGGATIYGYRNFPDRNQANFETTGNSWSQTAKTGAQVVEDVLTMISALQADRMYGPYWIYVPLNCSLKLEEDFKAASDKTIRQRVMEIEGINSIGVLDFLADDEVLMISPQIDTVAMVNGLPLQTIQWDIEGGFVINFKAFTIQIPLLRSDGSSSNRCGIVHMTVA